MITLALGATVVLQKEQSSSGLVGRVSDWGTEGLGSIPRSLFRTVHEQGTELMCRFVVLWLLVTCDYFTEDELQKVQNNLMRLVNQSIK